MNQIAKQQGRAPAPFQVEPRLPYHPQLEKIGITRATWLVLCDSIFPSAKEPQSIVLAIRYCQARKLDIMKKPVHVVPVWSTQAGKMVETVWPSVAEARITATRTGVYAGIEPTELGPMVTEEFTKDRNKQPYTFKVTYPEWAIVTVKKIVAGHIVSFSSPRLYWKETYSAAGKSTAPNDRWERAPVQMLEKCAEAAALRRAFPEELGNELTGEEMEGKAVDSLPQEALPAITSESLQKQAEEVIDAETGEVTMGEPPSDWMAKLDELLVGLDACKNVDAVKAYLGENEAGIQELAQGAPAMVRDQWTTAVSNKLNPKP